MDLRQYLFDNRMERKDLAEKVGCTPQTITDALHNRNISFKMAQRISMATNLQVGIAELLPHVYLFCVAEYRRNNGKL